MTDAYAKFVPSFDAVLEFHKANFDALVQAQTAFAKGFQELSKEFVALAQAHMESAAATGKSALAAKTFKDVVELNVEGAKTSYEKLVAADQGPRDRRHRSPDEAARGLIPTSVGLE